MGLPASPGDGVRPFGAAVLALALLGGLARAAAAQETHLIVITGVEGDPEHGETFHKWATAIIEAAKRHDGIADANTVYLAEKPDRDPSKIQGRSTRENVVKTFTDVASRCGPDDEVFVVLLGHGSFDGRQATFNLPGPDLTAADYAKLLEKFGSQKVVFVNTSSSSGGFLSALAGPGRTIVTATKTGGERNETLFPEFFVEALTGDAADKNRDGRVSVLEAFEYAKAKVTQTYQQKGLVLTEHAALEDGSDGAFAATLFLESQRARAAAIGAATTDPALRALLEDRQALEDRIAELKLRKGKMEAAQYDQELERLVTELALKTRAIQAMKKN
jgi:hypothetical protein